MFYRCTSRLYHLFSGEAPSSAGMWCTLHRCLVTLSAQHSLDPLPCQGARVICHRSLECAWERPALWGRWEGSSASLLSTHMFYSAGGKNLFLLHHSLSRVGLLNWMAGRMFYTWIPSPGRTFLLVANTVFVSVVSGLFSWSSHMVCHLVYGCRCRFILLHAWTTFQ